MTPAKEYIIAKIPWLHNQPLIMLTLIEMIIILVVTAIIILIELVAFHLSHRRLKKTHKVWDDILILAIHKPLQLVILVVGVSYFFDVFAAHFPSISLLRYTTFVRKAIIIIACLWAAFRYMKYIEHVIRNPDIKHRVDKAAAFALNRLLKILVLFIGSIAIFQLIGIPISALVAFGGAGALAFSLAAKDTLANVFGGIMLYIEKPFSVDDWILVIGKNIEGVVSEIGWRSTKIMNFDKRPIYIPNNTFTTNSVMNCTRMTHRRLVTSITLRYQDINKIKDIADEVLDYLANHEDIDQEQSSQACLDAFADSSVNLKVTTYTQILSGAIFAQLKQDIYLKISDIVQKHGADFAFPTQTLDIPSAISIESK